MKTNNENSIVEKVAALFGLAWLCVLILSVIVIIKVASDAGTADTIEDRELDEELIVAGHDLGYNWTGQNITIFETTRWIGSDLGRDVHAKVYETQCYSAGFAEACDYMFVREAVQDAAREEWIAQSKSPFLGVAFVTLLVSVSMCVGFVVLSGEQKPGWPS